MSLNERIKHHRANQPEPKQWVRRPEVLQCVQTPQPMHMLVPRNLLGSAWWDKTRKEAYASTDYHCVACGVHKSKAKSFQWLEGHELYTVNYVKGLWTYVETVPLCHYCHTYIHAGRMQMLLAKGEIHHAKYVAVIQYGDSVLAAAGLARLPPYDGKMASWSRWRLVLNGQKYKPLFATYNEWLRNFGIDYQEEELDD